MDGRMSEARQMKPELAAAGAPRGAAMWRARAVDQLAACLVAQGRQGELPALLERHSGSAGEAFVRFYLALLCAQEQKIDDAVAHLRRMLAGKVEEPRLRRLAFRVFLRFAQRKLKAAEWQAASQALSEAVVNCPQEPRALHELESLRGALPLAHVQSGNRTAAVRVLLEDLCKRPDDCTLLHHLALVHFWWAMDLEENPTSSEKNPTTPAPARIRGNYVFRDGQFVPAGPEQESAPEKPAAHPADDAWEGAIAFWSLLASHSSFWSHWRQVQQTCGCALQEQDIESLREKIVDERLTKTLQDFASHYLEKNLKDDAARHEQYLTALGLERKTAELWPRALDLWKEMGDGAAARAPQNPLLRFPGGILFFKKVGLLPDVNQIIDQLAGRYDDNPLLPQLVIYFSAAGFGPIAVLIDERKKADAALELLERLPEEHRDRPEFVFLQAQALLEKGKQAAVKQDLFAALAVWKQAWTALQPMLRKGGVTVAFKELLKSTREAVAQAVFQACEKESGKLKQQEKFNEAIEVLQEGFGVTNRNEMKGLLCILYCDRGDRLLNEKKFKQARRDFETALDLDKENARAKKSFGQTFLIEGLEIGAKDLNRAIEIMEKGMQYVGEDPQAAELLAQACNARAVEMLNDVSGSTPLSRFDESIRMLRRAIKLMNPKLKDSVLDTMVNEESVDAVEEATKELKEDTYKKALQNLALAGRFRRQKRAGDLNSEAVSILNSLGAYGGYGGRSSVDRAIEMLEEAARILNPRLGALMFMLEHMDESQVRNIGGPAATILVNLSTAYKIRRQLRGF
jgi:tetratricopeptide (TPR) repeat protein